MFYFQKLDVYRCAVVFLGLAARLSEKVPRGYGALADQLRRASLSIPLNIAEGTGKSGRDSRRFFMIARGSSLECAAILDALSVLEHQDQDALEEARGQLDRIAAMLWKMTSGNKRNVGSMAEPEPEPEPEPRQAD